MYLIQGWQYLLEKKNEWIQKFCLVFSSCQDPECGKALSRIKQWPISIWDKGARWIRWICSEFMWPGPRCISGLMSVASLPRGYSAHALKCTRPRGPVFSHCSFEWGQALTRSCCGGRGGFYYYFPAEKWYQLFRIWRLTLFEGSFL